MSKNIKKIIVVDDEAEIVKTMIRHLKRKGFTLGSAREGEEARRKIVEADNAGAVYDLVITDVVMPNEDGVDLHRWIKDVYPEISVLVISGFAASYVILETIRPELDDFCQKPLTPEKILGAIKGISQKRTAAGLT